MNYSTGNDKTPNGLKVLYISHYGVFRGAQRSLMELITGFPAGSVQPYFFTPDGTLVKYLKKIGIGYSLIRGGVSKFDHTKLGYYRGFRWMILARELLFVIPTLYTFLMFRRKAKQFDLIHINEITCLLPIVLAKKLYKKPVLVHARVVFRNDPEKKRTAFVLGILRKYADHIIAIDENVADSLPAPHLTVVHNSFSQNSLFTGDSGNLHEKIAFISRGHLNIGFIGAIHHNKGIFELLEAAKRCHDHKLDVRFLIVGTKKPEGKDVLHALLKKFGIAKDGNIELYSFIEQHALQQYVYPLGTSSDTTAFYKFIDLICFPSFSDALGRPVFEAGYFAKPAIVALDRSFPDTFIEGKTGLKIEAGNPSSLFDAIRFFYDNPAMLQEMGTQAQALAVTNFNVEANARKVLDIYMNLTA